MATETYSNGTTTIDAFEEFRRMAAQIHQQFNAPYSKVINAASTPPAPAQNLTDGTNDKFYRPIPSKTLTTNTFIKSWKVEHTAGRETKKQKLKFLFSKI